MLNRLKSRIRLWLGISPGPTIVVRCAGCNRDVVNPFPYLLIDLYRGRVEYKCGYCNNSYSIPMHGISPAGEIRERKVV